MKNVIKVLSPILVCVAILFTVILLTTTIIKMRARIVLLEETNCHLKERNDLENELTEADTYIEMLEDSYDLIIENEQLKVELQYLKEHIELINKLAKLKTETELQDDYLEIITRIIDDANKELINYGIYLGFDGKIYKKVG